MRAIIAAIFLFMCISCLPAGDCVPAGQCVTATYMVGCCDPAQTLQPDEFCPTLVSGGGVSYSCK